MTMIGLAFERMYRCTELDLLADTIARLSS